MSGRLRSSEELEEYLEAPVLAVIPKVPDWRRRKRPYLVSVARWRSPAAEAYRVLRTNVLSAVTATGAKSIVVTSAYSGEGKSATVANLGVVLARAGKRVSLVSADLRHPRLHELFFMLKSRRRIMAGRRGVIITPFCASGFPLQFTCGAFQAIHQSHEGQFAHLTCGLHLCY
jgi:Mrp family chromosome partitioning ATPase